MPLDYRPTQSQLTSVADYIDSASLIAQRSANAFKEGGKLLNKIYTENQERGAMQDLIKAYDPNNLNSYNEALAQVANKYKGVTSDTLQTLNGAYRTAMNAQLNVDNLSAAERKMDAYQNLINQAYYNGDISGTLKANNNAGAYAQKNNIRSDALKYGDVDKLRTTAADREHRAAMAAAQRAAMRRQDRDEVKEDAKYALLNAYKDFAVRGNSPEVYAHNMKLFQNLLNQAQAAGNALNQKDIYEIYGMLKKEQESLTADPYTPLNANNLQGTLSYSKYKDGERVGTVNVPYNLAEKASVPLDVNAQMQQLGYTTPLAPPPIEPKEEPVKAATPTPAQKAAGAASILQKASSAPSSAPPKTDATITDTASIYSPMPAKSTEPLIPKGTNVSNDASTGSVPASIGIMNKATSVGDVNSFAPTTMWMQNRESYAKYKEEQAKRDEDAEALLKQAALDSYNGYSSAVNPLGLTVKAKVDPIKQIKTETPVVEQNTISDLNEISNSVEQGYSYDGAQRLQENMDAFNQNSNVLLSNANYLLADKYQQDIPTTASVGMTTIAEASTSFLSGNSLEKVAEQFDLELGLSLAKGGTLNAETIANADNMELVKAIASAHNMNADNLSAAELDRIAAQINSITSKFTTIFNTGSSARGSGKVKTKGKTQNEARAMARLVAVGIVSNSIEDRTSNIYFDKYAFNVKESRRLTSLLAKELSNPKSETFKLYNQKQRALQRVDGVNNAYYALRDIGKQIGELWTKAQSGTLTQSDAEYLKTLQEAYKFRAEMLRQNAAQYLNN